MENACTSMTHARALHFLWPYVVRYAAHQLNLWPRVSQPEVSPTSLWTGSPGDASRFRVWGCLALVRDTSADKISPSAISCVFLGFPEDSFDYTFYHPPLHRFFDSRDVRFDESVPYYVSSPSGAASFPAVLLPAYSRPCGSRFCGEDPGGASSRGVGVGAESVPVRGPCSGGAGVGAQPVTAGDSSLRGSGVSGAVPGGATTGGAPSAGPGEPRMDPVTSGDAGSGGGATAAGVGARGERVGVAAAGAIAAGGAAAAAAAGAGAAVATVDAAAATSSSSVFPPPLPPLSPPLPHTWPLRRSPRACPSSPVSFIDLRTALFRSSPPRLSPSVLPSPPESALTTSLSTPVTDYYRTYRPVLSRVLASLVTNPRASLSPVSTFTATVTEFGSTHYLDYATSLVAAPPTRTLAVEGESALGCDALKDRQFELEFLLASSPHLCAMLLAPEGDPDALDIPTPRTYVEAMCSVGSRLSGSCRSQDHPPRRCSDHRISSITHLGLSH
ncbi:unnamed protein product [Closterium sp. NIES-54]